MQNDQQRFKTHCFFTINKFLRLLILRCLSRAWANFGLTKRFLADPLPKTWPNVQTPLFVFESLDLFPMPHINQYTILNIYTRARRICLLIRWFIAMLNLPSYSRHHVKTIFILCFKLSFLKCADRLLTLLLDFLLSFLISSPFFCYISIASLFPFGFYFNFLSFTFPSLFSSFFRLFITFLFFFILNISKA